MSSTIYIPGRGRVNLSAMKVDEAVREYDARLSFKMNNETHQWCIYISMPHGHSEVPVLGFPDIPHPDDALKRLYRADALRHGEKILDDIDRNNKAIKDKLEYASSEASGQVAEVAESALHREGKTPYHRSLPKKDPKQLIKE